MFEGCKNVSPGPSVALDRPGNNGGGPAVPHMQLAFVRHFKCLFDFYNLFCSILSFSPVLTKLTTN